MKNSITFRNNAFRHLMLKILVIIMTYRIGPSGATIINSFAHLWDSDKNFIVRNNQLLPMPIPATFPLQNSLMEYNFIEEVFLDTAIAHSGSAASDLKQFAHVYAHFHSFTCGVFVKHCFWPFKVYHGYA